MSPLRGWEYPDLLLKEFCKNGPDGDERWGMAALTNAPECITA
jgi:hypothetical protein